MNKTTACLIAFNLGMPLVLITKELDCSSQSLPSKRLELVWAVTCRNHQSTEPDWNRGLQSGFMTAKVQPTLRTERQIREPEVLMPAGLFSKAPGAANTALIG